MHSEGNQMEPTGKPEIQLVTFCFYAYRLNESRRNSDGTSR